MKTTFLQKARWLVTAMLQTIKTSRLSVRYPFAIPIVGTIDSLPNGSVSETHPQRKTLGSDIDSPWWSRNGRVDSGCRCRLVAVIPIKVVATIC